MVQLPTELIQDIIDLVAKFHPGSLPSCALVSQQWNPRSQFHLEKFFRHPRLTMVSELRALVEAINTHPHLAKLPASLEVSPDHELSQAFTSYIPFLHLCSRALPNVTRLFLGETLQWAHYPPLYVNGAVGRSFYAVTKLDLSCRFKSAQDLFRAIRSFENVEVVRLLHPDPFLSPIVTGQLGSDASLEVKLRRTLRFLEVPLSVLLPVLKVAGDHVEDLSICCPPPSVLQTLAVDKPALRTPLSSFLALKTVRLTVPTDPGSQLHTGLQKLRRLALVPIRKPGAVYSLFLLSCEEHCAVGGRVVGASKTRMRRVVQSPYRMLGPLEGCEECRKREEREEALMEEVLWKLSSIEEKVVHVKQVVVQEADNNANDRDEKTLESLPHAEASHRAAGNAAKSNFLPGTRVGLFEEIKDWLEGRSEESSDKAVCILTGSAGTGKSTIASEFARQRDDKGGYGASFFFVRGEADLDSTRLVFPTLAHQLAQSQDALHPHIIRAAREHLKKRKIQKMRFQAPSFLH